VIYRIRTTKKGNGLDSSRSQKKTKQGPVYKSGPFESKSQDRKKKELEGAARK